ncbi:hypothetical protein FAZ78_00365 [Cereibacter changlensis]|uniref:Uncharacterized protein n=1 Tax=Cereibacter changlensis TaxID=402884 RepID=A0A4U0Z5H8_9RHOB|nr:hypothetical protein [Cereibacter changlensis]TKA98546.1 hypothetical protein FAZ78_00365 [Cereibacter changlensis]
MTDEEHVAKVRAQILDLNKALNGLWKIGIRAEVTVREPMGYVLSSSQPIIGPAVCATFSRDLG